MGEGKVRRKRLRIRYGMKLKDIYFGTEKRVECWKRTRQSESCEVKASVFVLMVVDNR